MKPWGCFLHKLEVWPPKAWDGSFINFKSCTASNLHSSGLPDKCVNALICFGMCFFFEVSKKQALIFFDHDEIHKDPPYVPPTSYHVVPIFFPKVCPTVTGLDLNFHRLDKHRQAAKTPEHFGELLVQDILRRFACDVDRALRCVDEWMWKWGSCCWSQILHLNHKKTGAWTWLNLVGMASTNILQSLCTYDWRTEA